MSACPWCPFSGCESCRHQGGVEPVEGQLELPGGGS